MRAVIAESFERIHRSNLVGMGVLPLQFVDGESAESLGLTGRETFTIEGLSDLPRQVTVRADDTDVHRHRSHRHSEGGRLLPARRHPPVRAAPAQVVIELSDVEARVVGALVEKERTVPDSYPLTVNSLKSACNQTSNRSPVVSYDEHTIESALGALRERELVRIVYSVHNRAAKYRHVVDEVLGLDGRSMALLCVLLLRGPQTVGELRGRTERLATFDDVGQVESVLDDLARHPDGPIVRQLPRLPGQKDSRWAHLLSGEPDIPLADRPTPAPRRADEIALLREEVAALREEVAELRSRLP